MKQRVLLALTAIAGTSWWAPAPAQQLAALLLIFLPGYLLLIALRKSQPHPLLVIIIGIVMMYSAGIASNFLAALLKTPQMDWWAWLAQVSMTLILLATAWRHLSTDVQPNLPRIRVRIVVGGILLLLIPIGAFFAASIMNNFGNPVASIAVLAILSFILLWSLFNPSRALVPFAIFCASLAIILLGSMRGDFLTGTDLSSEYFLANLAHIKGYWVPSLSSDAYNSSLGVTVLPNYLAHLFSVSLSVAFRVLIPTMYALVPVVIYTMFKQHHHPRIGVLASLIFIAQPAFVIWSPVPGRQMVAFLFFAALVWSIFDTTTSARGRNLQALLFGTFVILSHYSTGYVTLALLIIGTALARIAQWWVARERPDVKSLRLKWSAIAALVGVALVWYGPVTHVGDNLVTTVRSSVRIMEQTGFNPFNATGYASGTGLAAQLNLGAQREKPSQILSDYEDYVQNATNDTGLATLATRDDSVQTKVNPNVVSENDDTAYGQFLIAVNKIVRALMRILLVLGLLTLFWRLWKRRRGSLGFTPYSIAAGSILIAVIVVPGISIEYDLGRTTQQLMILLALPILIGAQLIVRAITLNRANNRTSPALLAATMFVLCTFSTGTLYVLTRATPPQMMLSNRGDMYEQIYVTDGELRAARWLNENRDSSVPVAAGYFSSTRLPLAGIERPTLRHIFPWSIPKDSYLYRGNYELTSNNASFYYRGTYLTYPYPDSAISDAKDVIYGNTSAEIYR